MIPSELAAGTAARGSLRVITAILTLCALSSWGAAAHISSSRLPPSTVATGFHHTLGPGRPAPLLAHPAAALGAGDRWNARGPADLFGNEISDAVARYTLDDTGDLYEVHSPQTELPRLTAPVG
jgi:hypothetical protein